jgi:hypothetical protein
LPAGRRSASLLNALSLGSRPHPPYSRLYSIDPWCGRVTSNRR